MAKKKQSRSESDSIFVRVKKTKPKSVRYLKNVSETFRTKERKADALLLERSIRERFPLLRKIYGGFTSAEGYDLRYIKRWPEARLNQARKYLSQVNRLTSGESWQTFSLHKATTLEEHQAIYRHTRQGSDDPKHPLKAYVLFSNVKGARVRYVEEEYPIAAAMGRPIVKKRLRAEVVRPVKRGLLLQRDYIFDEVLGFQPGVDVGTPQGAKNAELLGTAEPWEQMLIAMERLLAFLPQHTASGEPAWYRLLSDRGPIDGAATKSRLMARMQRYAAEYDPTFVETLIGVRFQGGEFESRKIQRRSEEMRQKYREQAAERRKARARIDWDYRIAEEDRRMKANLALYAKAKAKRKTFKKMKVKFRKKKSARKKKPARKK